MDGQVQYFVIFKPQKGETSPAFSFMDKVTMDQALGKNIIQKSYVVPAKQIHTPEEVVQLLQRFKDGK